MLTFFTTTTTSLRLLQEGSAYQRKIGDVIMANPAVILDVGYVMSSRQLSDLWHYDMWLGHVLMDLPLRKCTASPSNLPDLPPMDPADYQRLKNQVRAMWISAQAHKLTCQKGPFGWGLFFSKEFETSDRYYKKINSIILLVPVLKMC